MPSAVEQPLHLLLPTASCLPAQLINVAESLLAQSKAVAPRLKSDEEIARAYACCHIACERLKNKFGLEVGKVGPPCGPRVYKKLYGFLEAALPAASAPGTPRAGRAKDAEGKGTSTPRSGKVDARSGLSGTPRSGRAATMPGSRAVGSSLGKRGRGGVSDPTEEAELPRYTMPLIRHLSTTFDTPEAPTHVYAGVESVYRHLQTQQQSEDAEPQTPSKRRRTGRVEAVEGRETRVLPTAEQLPAFVAAIYIQTILAMYPRDIISGADKRREVAESVHSYFTKPSTPSLSLDLGHLTSDIESYTLLSKTDNWVIMEWYTNLPTLERQDNPDELPDDDEDAGPVTPRKRPAKTPLRRKEKHAHRPLEDDEEERSASGLLPGLGTMFQPGVDWLSDERRADFAAWKREVMAL